MLTPSRESAHRVAVAGLATLLLALSGAASAGANHPSAGERRLRQLEIEMLGPEHAAEHARERAAMRASSATPAAIAPRAAGPPSEVGAWTTAPFALPIYAIHMALLPTGDVLIWGYLPDLREGDPEGHAALWTPAKGTGPESIQSVPPPRIDADGDGDTEQAPLYYGGESILPDGELLIAGGELADDAPPYTRQPGIRRVFTFNAWTKSWTEQPQMERGRWYPSQVLLGDGRTVILSGLDETNPTPVVNDRLELFTQPSAPGGTGTIERRASGDRRTDLYPHLFTLPSGDVLLAGPGRSDSAILDTEDFTWSELPPASMPRRYGTAVLRPGGPAGSSLVTQIGGYDDTTWSPSLPATASAETIDAAAPAAAWHPDAPLNVPRANHNTVLLPDGSMVTVGGGRGSESPLGGFVVEPDGRDRQVELYDPATDAWRLGPSQQEDRAYHSTALLLPDGRVLSAGDNYNGSPGTVDTAEIYSPPYLFRGRRPAIGSAPESVAWGDVLGIRSASAGVSRAVLMAPGAVTHSVDMSQRQVPLSVVRAAAGQGLDVAAPPSAAVAPPGPYMLFLLNDAGVPSVARWISLDGSAPDRPRLPPDTAGPRVEVRLRMTPRALRRGRLAARLSVDEPALVRLRLTVRGGGGGRRRSARARLRLERAGSARVVLRFPRAARRAISSWKRTRAVLSVRAWDGAGNRTAWRR